ncbi:hypothetical protein AB0B88_16370 [Micromonospora haikouensis]|uniref:hypothetical protein n=1 Tax=Actinomycetes TaxID=1760 RepID=UPI0033FDA896
MTQTADVVAARLAEGTLRLASRVKPGWWVLTHGAYDAKTDTTDPALVWREVTGHSDHEHRARRIRTFTFTDGYSWSTPTSVAARCANLAEARALGLGDRAAEPPAATEQPTTTLINLYAGDRAERVRGSDGAVDILARDVVPCFRHDPEEPEATDPTGYVARCPSCAVRWHILRDNGIGTRETLTNQYAYGDPKAIIRVVVRPGQVWADYDPRSPQRRIRVVAVYDGPHFDPPGAVVELVDQRGRPARGHEAQQLAEPGRQTTIRLDRFRPTSTGYVLVSDVDPGPVDPTPAEVLRLVELYGDARRDEAIEGEKGGADDIREAEERAALLLARVRTAVAR